MIDRMMNQAEKQIFMNQADVLINNVTYRLSLDVLNDSLEIERRGRVWERKDLIPADIKFKYYFDDVETVRKWHVLIHKEKNKFQSGEFFPDLHVNYMNLMIRSYLLDIYSDINLICYHIDVFDYLLYDLMMQEKEFGIKAQCRLPSYFLWIRK